MNVAAGYKYHRTSSRLVAVTSLWLWAVPDGLPVPPAGKGYELPWGDPLSQTGGDLSGRSHGSFSLWK